MNRILIVEDEPNIVSFLEKGLRKHGFATTSAGNAKDGLELALSSAFDLLILDLGLPDKDGLEVVAELRGQGQTLPIIILTARDDIDDKVCGLEGGANDYITKPFRFEELLASGEEVTYDTVLADLKARDARDEGRAIAPLKPASDALLLDTSELDIETAFREAVTIVNGRMDER